MSGIKSKYKLNYKFGEKETSDLKMSFSHLKNAKLPSKMTLQSNWGPIFDQGQLGSCVSNSVAGCIRYCCQKNNKVAFNPSRLFIYYNGRTLRGYNVNDDTGLTIKDGYKSVNKRRVCREESWPYEVDEFATKPPDPCYIEARKLNSDFKYYSLNQDLLVLKTCIFEGYPISFGMLIYESIDSEEVAKTGVVPMPSKFNEQMLGGHALSIVGYDDIKQVFVVANSWSSAWGDKGFCYIPYSYLLDHDLANDFWTVRQYTITAGLDTSIADMVNSIIEREMKTLLENNEGLEEYVKSVVAVKLNDYVSSLVHERINTSISKLSLDKK